MINPDKTGLVWIRDLTGGLNDSDAPQDLADDQCQIAQNVEWVVTRFAQRRQGGVNSIHATEPWGAQTSLLALMRHTPNADESTAELWGVDNDTPPAMGRLAAGNQFAAVTVADGWTDTSAKFINGVSLNGKFFIAGNTAVDRLHVWTGTTLRRVGLATPAAPTVADTGAGTYPATIRYYKVQWYNNALSPETWSELSPSVTFTPSGTGTAARVTQPTPPNEGETHWVVWASPDNVNFYFIANTVIATTTVDDNTAPAAYATVQPLQAGRPSSADYYTPPISAKYLLADEDRLLLLSSWETASKASAVMWTPVNGTTPANFTVADDERVPSTNRLDLDRSDGGGITGGAILAGVIYVFKYSHIYRLDRTGDADLPYRAVPITKSLGAVSHKSLVVGEDDAGRPCLYFISRRGPYRITSEGVIEYLGRDIETLFSGLELSLSIIPPFGVWHESKRQVQWWVTTSSGGTFPDRKLVLHVRHARRGERHEVRGGWALHLDGAAVAQCACMFANTLGATMSLDLKPYVGQVWVSGLPDGPCIKYDADGTYTDRGGNATTYIARVKPGAFPPGGVTQKGGVTQTYVLGTPANRTLGVDIIRDFGAETRSGTAVLPTAGSPAQSRVLVKIEDDALAAGAMYAELIVDDEGYGSTAWTVHAVGLRVRGEAQV